MSHRFDDLVDTQDLSPSEREKLERVHELLLTVGPPPELSASITRPPAQVIEFPTWRRPRAVFAMAAVVAAVAASFAGGYFAGEPSGMAVSHVVAFASADTNHFASLRVGQPDIVGNNPMVLTVSGLPSLGKHGYYELFTWRHGKPGFPCTGFKMRGHSLTVEFNVPYAFESGTKLVITAVVKGRQQWPGRVVMRSV